MKLSNRENKFQNKFEFNTNLFLNFYIIFLIEMWRFVFYQFFMFKKFSVEEAFFKFDLFL